jgi:bidirectional [NiFe] hydrogenase diaphorase subunit
MTLDELRELAEKECQEQKKIPHKVNVCVAAACLSLRSDQVLKAMQSEVKKRGIEDKVRVKGEGCMGLCARGPLVLTEPQHTYYQSLKADDTEALGAILENLDGKPVPEFALSPDLPFFASQQKIVLENCGDIDPERIEDYIAADGYTALLTCLSSRSREDVVQELVKSGFRGRGGGGFSTGHEVVELVSQGAGGTESTSSATPTKAIRARSWTGRSWKAIRIAVLEGMAIAAFAVGASTGYIYCRAEYPLAVKRLKIAIKQAEKLGLLGNKIGESNFSFTVEIRLGAGAFVCGEETALIASVEGNRGVPRPRPPFPAYSGVNHSPTLLNNVETNANVAPIIRKGGDWYASIGTEKSKGTKVFALAGDINNTGLIEVPMGMKLRDIVFEMGDGIPNDRKFKAVQTGGPSGGCIPEQFLDMAVDYESLASVGSIMGSGGMIVMDDTACMVDVAKFFMDFVRDESCGKCVPCRVGTTQMHGMLERISEGEGHASDLDVLARLGTMVKATALCGLGQTAPNPVISTMKYFRHEYEKHITDKTCTQGKCPCGKPEPATSKAGE